MINKLLFFFFGLLLSNTISAQTQFTDNGIKYEITSTSLFEVKVIANSPIYSGSITVPASVTYNSQTYSVVEIGAWAFQNCIGLTSVSLPNTVRTFGNFAFMGCTALTSISLPNTLTTINSSALRNCSSLTTVLIPLSVTSIGGSAFESCTGLTTIYLQQPNPSAFTLGGYVFWGVPTSVCLHVPSGSQSLYSAASQWSAFTCVTVNNLGTNDIIQNSLSISPNPAKDFVTISNLVKGADVALFDVTGKLLYQTKSFGTTLTINTSSYKNGMYLMKVDGQAMKLLISK